MRTAAERASRAAEVRGDAALRAEADDLLRGPAGVPTDATGEMKKATRELRRLSDDLAAAFSSSAEAA